MRLEKYGSCFPGRGCRSRRTLANLGLIEPTSVQQERALLTILVATGEKTIEAFQASANPVDADFLVELERIIERSRQELIALAQADSSPSRE